MLLFDLLDMDHVQKYEEIAEELSLDKEKDRKAAKVLDSLIAERDISRDIKKLGGLIKNKKVYVFGAGPSLKKDIGEIKKHGLDKGRDSICIAADGAGKALLEEGIVPHIHVTDLDGFPETILEINRKGGLTVVHAHGDNIDLIKDIVPRLGNIVGTTQTRPFGKLRNFGGFTDGDRCVFLADHFRPEYIVLAGMDFGRVVGEYAGRYDKKSKVKKLAIGKMLIEELAKESHTPILNMTFGGEDIRNVPRISAERLKAFSSG